MDTEPNPVLAAQKQAHPELGDLIDELQKYVASKLYHQLTEALFKYLAAPAFLPSKPSAGSELLDLFNGFVKPFENKFDKLRWVQILDIVSKPQKPDDALGLIAPFEELVSTNRDARYLMQTLKAEKLTLAGRLDEAKELLSSLGQEIDQAYEVHTLIQSSYHKTYALLWDKLEKPQEYFASSILYLKYTPLTSIPEGERALLAFNIGVAALIAEEEFNFGELLQQELLASIVGTEYAWLKDLLVAFGEGKFDLFDAAMASHSSKISATPALKQREDSVLRPKMCALSLMELAFRKPKKQRRLSFEEIGQHCRVGPKEVEYLVMKSMCANLVSGQIDQVAQLVIVTWVKPRILDNARIDLMRERMDAWAAQTGLLLTHLEEMTPELLVS